ncbi:MAG: hypothetical protein MZU95_02640 [Desulfomicrobium escambiense]|nr:hypothetical protein [Desulfomicrobium escambiense]
MAFLGRIPRSGEHFDWERLPLRSRGHGRPPRRQGPDQARRDPPPRR